MIMDFVTGYNLLNGCISHALYFTNHWLVWIICYITANLPVYTHRFTESPDDHRDGSDHEH